MKYDCAEYAYLLKALSDETRLRIVTMLGGGELCACKILEEFRITQPTLSHHMKTLKASGLVRARKDGVWTKYTLNKDKMALVGSLFSEIAEMSEAEAGPFICGGAL